MKKLLAILSTALFATGVFAGATVTKGPSSFELHSMPDNKLVPGPWPASAELCETIGTDMAKAGKLGTFACVTRTPFTVTMNCVDEKAPKLYLATVKNPEDSKDYLELPGASFTVDTYVEMADLYVHTAAWPAGYPNCWIRGEAPRAEWRLNTKDEPGKAFMERRDPSMPPGDLIAEEPDSVEPVCWGNECTAVPAP